MLDQGRPLLIDNAGQDPRFPPEGISLFGAKPCLSYAGIPLITGAQRTGTLAVLARDANEFKPEHLTLLEVLGRQAVTRLELYNRIRVAGAGAAGCGSAPSERSAIERSLCRQLDSIPALVTVLDTAGRVVRNRTLPARN